jgi:Subtilase family
MRRTTMRAYFGASLGICATACAMAGDVAWRTPTADAITIANPVTALQSLAARSDARHVVVEFARPMTEARKQRLHNAGVQLLAPLGGNSFFAALDSNVDVATAADGSLVGARAIQTEWKLDPFLAAGGRPQWAVVKDGADPVVGAYVMLHPDVDVATDGPAIAFAASGVVRDFVLSVNSMVIEAPLSALRTIAAHDAVQWVEPALPQLGEQNAENRTLTGANIVQAAPYNLNGAGVTVMVYDGGTALATHGDFGGRLTTRDNAPLSSHATHVSGTVGGSGAGSAGNNRGMAPGVTILSYGFQYDGTPTFLYTNPGDIQADYTAAIGLGADIANNSIGTNTESNGFDCSFQGNYGITDALIDNIVRGSVSGGVPFRVVWAAGNERQGSRCDVEGHGDYYSTAPPATAKNHLAIGAVNSNDDSMTTFSSWGPTDDGRLKPDFCAPGCQVGGDAGVTSTTSNGSYGSLCGTSMASPTTCGLASLLLQDYRARFPGPDPRNSTLKVLFAQNALDRGNVGPDYQFGYGSIRVQPTIDFMRSGQFAEEEAAQGEEVVFQMSVAPGTPQVKITLAWDDPPGTPNVIPSLINDLDLVVRDATNNQHFPWTLNPTNPGAAAVRTVRDNRNNIEQVVVDNPPAGAWTVTISGFNVPVGPQPFSIAASLPLLVDGVRIRLLDEVPALMAPGVGLDLDVEILAATETIVPGSQTLHFRYMGGAYQSMPLTPQGGSVYRASLPPPVCGATPEFYVSAVGSVSGLVTSPSDAPTTVFNSQVAVDIVATTDDAEIDRGWTVSLAGDTATTGVWNRMDPAGTAAQPEDDTTPTPGVACWVTDGQGGALGAFDVDGGRTTLTSPTMSIGALVDPKISYSRWYSNHAGAGANADVFVVQISNNAGASWVALETVGPAGPDADGGWSRPTFRIADFVPPTSQMRLRFIAEDAATASVVEAAVDDVRIDGRECSASLADCNVNGIVDADDISSGRSSDANSNSVPDECDPPGGCAGDVDGNGNVDLSDLALLLGAFGTSSGDPGFVAAADFDSSGSIDLADLALLLGNFGQSCP